MNVIGLAKRLDEVFLPGRSEFLMIHKSFYYLKLLLRIRDEAHRFAISYHRDLREKKIMASELDRNNGIGKVRKKYLLSRFGSVERIKKLTNEE